MNEKTQAVIPEYHAIVELKIDNITNLGAGVGRLNGWVVLVPFVLKGERVRVQIYKNHANYSEADLLEVLEPSPDRVTPFCRHFGICGGCQYQHIAYSQQLALKTQHIAELFERQLRLQPKINTCIASPKLDHYRGKLTPHYPRIKNGNEPIGFQKVGKFSLEDIENCPIATENINRALPKLRKNVRAKTTKRGGTLLLRDTLDGVTSTPREVVHQQVGNKIFEFYAGEFFQNNAAILPKFVDYILQQARGDGIRYLVDAYCGVGLFGICGADAFERVAGIEVNAEAIRQAQRNAQQNHIRNINFIAGSAENIFAGLEFPPEATTILMDPPRRGSDALFLEQLLRYHPQRIVYVSCGPDTQMRDLKLLLGEYEIVDVQPFDLFPQTRHIENVVTLQKKSAEALS